MAKKEGGEINQSWEIQEGLLEGWGKLAKKQTENWVCFPDLGNSCVKTQRWDSMKFKGGTRRCMRWPLKGQASSQPARLLRTQSGQFSNPLDCLWLNCPDWIASRWLNRNSLPPRTTDSRRQPQWPVVRLTLLHWEQPSPLPNPLSQAWGTRLEGTCLEEDGTTLPPIPSQTPHFFF